MEALLGQAETDGLLKQCNLRDKSAYRQNYHKTNATIRDPIEIASTQTDIDPTLPTTDFMEFKKFTTEALSQLTYQINNHNNPASASADTATANIVYEHMLARINTLEQTLKNTNYTNWHQYRRWHRCQSLQVAIFSISTLPSVRMNFFQQSPLHPV